MKSRKRTRLLGAGVAAALITATIPMTANAKPSQTGCENRNLNQIDKLLECVDGDDALEHLAALQAIADANGGTRASGTPGYDESADYVADLLEEAGFIVERQEFECTMLR